MSKTKDRDGRKKVKDNLGPGKIYSFCHPMSPPRPIKPKFDNKDYGIISIDTYAEKKEECLTKPQT